MRAQRFVFACACALAVSVFAVPTVDFNQETGKIRPELHSSGFGPMVCSCPQEAIDDIKSMGFAMARTHDWSLINPAERVCDYYHIFPLMHLDAKDPKNYHFGPTDYLLKRTREETGLDIFFRLGTAIEHSGPKVHFNSLIPEDFDKVAETFAGTIRHYNRGWANGYTWNIKYWEIWNEPDGTNNMWCEPEGDTPQNAAQRREKFVKFFVTVLKRLKSEFPDVKVGGPALCWMNAAYFKQLLQACKEAGVAPDFISWHSYSSSPDGIMRTADEARKLCDSFGFTKCELIINEWHFFGNYTWGELRSPDPAVQARVLSGPGAHNGIDSATFVLSTLAKFQSSKFDQAYYYGCRHMGSWGYKDEQSRKYKTYYALKLFGDLVKKYPTICSVTGAGKGDPLAFAVKSADGAKRALLVVDYRGKGRSLTVNVKGVEGKKTLAKVLDYTRNLEPCAADLQDGVLKLEKADENSAAFLVTFCEENPKVSAWENGGRAKILKWYSEHQFGTTPIGRPADEVIGERSVSSADGKITINITLALPEGASKDHPVPVFLFGDHSCLHKAPYTKTVYEGIPTNSITARGYAYVTWNFNDVCPNAARYSKDLDRWADGVIAWQATGDPKNRDIKRTPTSWGTLGAWAWGHSRVMDWIETRPELDAKRVAVLGHSRGGKTALWAAAQDERFAMGISNDSGCGGAKLNNFDCPKSEHIGQILHNFPNWFCLNYAEWIDRDAEITVDSDNLLRLIAPRLCYVASATEDPWAGPPAEKEAWTRAHDLWEAYGHPERMGYHIREGKHKLLPFDWDHYMDFADKYMK